MKIKELHESANSGIVIVGDSIAQGISMALPTAQSFAAKGIPSAKIISLARTAGSANPAAAIISAGSNDIVKGQGDPANLETNLQQIKSAMNSATRIWIVPYDEIAAQVVTKVAGSDPTIPLASFSSADHVHPSNYAAIVKKIEPLISSAAATAQPAAKDAAQPKADTKAATPDSELQKTHSEFSVSIPQDRVSPDVMDLQKVLVAFGYDIGPPGIDGVMGKYTIGAIKQAQGDLKLPTSGSVTQAFIDKINVAIADQPKLQAALTKSSAADLSRKTSAEEEETLSAEQERVKQTQLPDSVDMATARQAAEAYMGKAMSDEDWSMLLHATKAEASFNLNEYAMVMASMLNRARNSRKTVGQILVMKNQFQAVTGVHYTDKSGKKHSSGPSANYTSPINSKQAQMLIHATSLLPRISHSQENFTAASRKAYGAGTNVGYLDQMIKNDGKQYGGTVFNTEMLPTA